MTPEQLAHLRQWAEWGESPTPETTIALLDLVDALTKRLEAVRELHKPIPNWNALYCAECNLGRDLVNEEGVPWPCPTRRALDGD